MAFPGIPRHFEEEKSDKNIVHMPRHEKMVIGYANLRWYNGLQLVSIPEEQ